MYSIHFIVCYIFHNKYKQYTKYKKCLYVFSLVLIKANKLKQQSIECNSVEHINRKY